VLDCALEGGGVGGIDALERLTKPAIARILEIAEEAELRRVAYDPKRTMRRSAWPWSIAVA